MSGPTPTSVTWSCAASSHAVFPSKAAVSASLHRRISESSASNGPLSKSMAGTLCAFFDRFGVPGSLDFPLAFGVEDVEDSGSSTAACGAGINRGVDRGCRRSRIRAIASTVLPRPAGHESLTTNRSEAYPSPRRALCLSLRIDPAPSATVSAPAHPSPLAIFVELGRKPCLSLYESPGQLDSGRYAAYHQSRVGKQRGQSSSRSRGYSRTQLDRHSL